MPDLFTTFIVAYRIASCPYQMFIPSFLRLPENCLGKDGFPHCDFIHSPWRYSHAFRRDYVDSCDTADSGAITGLPTYLCLFSACCPGPSCALYPQVGRLYITILIFLGAKSRISLKNKELTHVYSPLFFCIARPPLAYCRCFHL